MVTESGAFDHTKLISLFLEILTYENKWQTPRYCLIVFLKKHNIFTPKLVPVREDLCLFPCFKIFMDTNKVFNYHNHKK